MKRVLLTLCALVALAASPLAQAQQGDGGGGTGGGGGSGGTGGGGSTGTVSSTANSGGMTSSGSGGGSVGRDLEIVGTAGVEIRQGFLEPVSRVGTGFLTPSNAASNRPGSTRGTAGGTTRTAGSTRLSAAGGRGGVTGLGGRAGQGGFGSQFGTTGLGAGAGSMAPLRVPIRIGGNTGVNAPDPSLVVPRFNQRIGSLPGVAGVNSVSLQAQGRTAVLRGTVATPGQRDLLGRLALLEPGISAVQNELAVSPRPAGAEPLPTPTAGANSP